MGKAKTCQTCISFLHILILQMNGLILSILNVKFQGKGKVSATDYTGIVNEKTLTQSRAATEQP